MTALYSCTSNEHSAQNQSSELDADSTISENNKPLFDDADGQMAAYYDSLAIDLESVTYSAAKGDRVCQELLANMYAYGIGGVKADRTKAFLYYRELANSGHVEAQAIAGYMMLYGFGPIEDAEAGLEMLSASANSDCPLAFYVLGNFYNYNTAKTDENQSKAKLFYSAAANLGMTEAQAELDQMNSIN